MAGLAGQPGKRVSRAQLAANVTGDIHSAGQRIGSGVAHSLAECVVCYRIDFRLSY